METTLVQDIQKHMAYREMNLYDTIQSSWPSVNLRTDDSLTLTQLASGESA